MTSRTYEIKRIQFESDGTTCRGRLYLPAGSVALPCVVMAHGFSGTMDWIIPDFAARFADAGLAVLAFDYRCFGESDGTPRQLVSTKAQLIDLRQAIGFARSIPEIDPNRIALWGTSLGGSHVIAIASTDPSIRAVVANVPALDVWHGANLRQEMADRGLGWLQVIRSTLHLFAHALYDEVRGLLRRQPHYIRVYGDLDDSVFSDPALAERFGALAESSPSWQNRVTPRFLFHAPRYVEGTMERIRMPLLVTLARDDTELSSDFVAEKASRAAQSEVQIYPAGHFDMYHGEILKRVAAAHAEFLSLHLLPMPESQSRDVA